MRLLADVFVQPIWFTMEMLVHIGGNFSCALTAHAEKNFFLITARGSAEQIIYILEYNQSVPRKFFKARPLKK